jgi:valyl-tRNA synthetase
MSEKRVEGYRHFVNKLWNAARFSFMHLGQGAPDIDREKISLEDRWILSRLSKVTTAVTEALDTYRFNEAAGELYQFVWHEFCDWYLEIIKPALYGKDERVDPTATRSVLSHVLRSILLMLHPFMPFVTEEIWHHFPGTEGSIMTARFPASEEKSAGVVADDDAEARMALSMAVITGIRNIRGEMNLPPSLRLTAQVQSPDAAIRETVDLQRDMIANLARLEEITVAPPGDKPKAAVVAEVDSASIFVPLEGVVDFEKERQRLEKEIGKLAGELQVVSKKLSNEDFLQKAPPPVVDKAREKQQALEERKQKLGGNLERIRALIG